jgi:hypothetical protein
MTLDCRKAMISSRSCQETCETVLEGKSGELEPCQQETVQTISIIRFSAMLVLVNALNWTLTVAPFAVVFINLGGFQALKEKFSELRLSWKYF